MPAKTKRQRSFGQEDGSSRIRSLCIATYISIKLMDGAGVSLLGKLLTMKNHSEYKTFKSLVVDLGALRLAHLLLTVMVPHVLARPKVLAAMFAAALVLFATLFSMTLYRMFAGFLLLPTWLCASYYVFGLLVIGLDAVADALSRAMGIYLQPAKKFGAVVVDLALLAQLGLPAQWCVAPIIVVAVLAAFTCGWASYEAARVGPTAAGTRAASEVATAGRLPSGILVLFLVAVVVGDNGEEFLDQLSNIEIDKDLAGGKLMATAIKTGISVVASIASASAFTVTYKRRFNKKDADSATDDESTLVSREVKFAIGAVVAWGAFQGFRLYAVNMGALGHGWFVGGLVLADKLTGSQAQDACGLLQTLTLSEMAVPVESVHPVLGLTPHLAGSFAEVVDKLNKTWITKSLLDDASWLRFHAGAVVSVLTVSAVVAHSLMASLLVNHARSKAKTE